MLAWSAIRRRALSIAGLSLLVGLVGAVVISAAAGARRSETALARFKASTRSGDVSLLVNGFGYTPSHAQLNALRSMPDVGTIGMVRFFALVPVHASANLNPAAPVDRAFGSIIDGSRLVRGRRADPRVADEVTIGEVLAAQLHLGIGAHLDFSSYSPAQFAAFAGSSSPPAPAGPRVRLRIVGIERRPGDLGDQGAAGGVVILSPAFNHAHLGDIANYGVAIEVRTRHGASDVPAVTAAAQRILAKSGGVSAQAPLNDTQGAQSAVNVVTLALWILAAVAALAGAVTIGIVLTREISIANTDHETLRSMGLTRRQRFMVSGPAAAIIATGGGLLAVVVAVAASPWFPFGVARRADPDVGVHVDWVVVAPGIVAITVAVLAVAFVVAWRSTRQSALEAMSGASRRTAGIVETAARAGMAPTATNGLRMALEPGRGRTGVPIRSAYLGAVFGILGVTAVLVFVANLDHLATTPRLYGSTWDFQTADTHFSSSDPGRCNAHDFGLAREPGVAAVAAVCDNEIARDGHPVIGWGFTPVRGTIEPEVVTGRAPSAPNEVALGAHTLSALKKSVGDTVQGRGPRGAVHYRIVGQAVFPKLGNPQNLADGAAFTGDGFARIFDPSSTSSRHLLGRYVSGTDRLTAERRIAAIPALGPPIATSVPVAIDRVRKVGWLPTTLALLLTGLALLAIGHTLITSARRRRRELALLKTLGFDRGQIRATVAWQATTLATVGLVIGLPAGIIVGEYAWRLVANGLGVAATAPTPVLALLLTVPAAFALVNLLAYFPARAAARARPGNALRFE
jgi:ABC-type lipoprotein release transport system permease subunit